MIVKGKRILSIIMIVTLFFCNITSVYADEMIDLTAEGITWTEEGKELSENEIVVEEHQGTDIILSENQVILENKIEQEEISLSANATILDKMAPVKEEERESVVEEVLKEKIYDGETLSENEIETPEVNEASNKDRENTLSENAMIFEINDEKLLKTVSQNGVENTETLSANSIEELNDEQPLSLKVEGKEIGKYSKWSELLNAIKEVAEVTREYTVEIAENTDLDEQIKIPSNIGKLMIKGTNQKKPVLLSGLGDLKLLSNVTLDGVELRGRKYNSKTKEYTEYFSNITLNGKELVLANSRVQAGTLKGNSRSVLKMENSSLTLISGLSGVGNVSLESSTVKTKTASVASNLYMKNSVLEGTGKISLKNLISNDENNRIILGDNLSKNIVSITGIVSSDSDDGDDNAVLEKEAEGEIISEKVKLRKNAVTLQVNSLEEMNYPKGSLLANVSKAGAAWFAIGSHWEQRNGEQVRVVKDITYKIGTKLYCGSGADHVLLSSSPDEKEENFCFESSFATLQEAFNEIDKIGDSSKYYRVLLNNNQEDVATSLKKGLKFPAKAKGLILRKSSNISEGNLYFKGNITLKCPVKFEDIIFENAGKSNVSVGKYTLYLKNCYSSDNSEAVVFNSITGNGVKNTSKIILEDTILKSAGQINGIGEVSFLGGNEEVSALEQENIIRIVPAYPELIALGKLNIGNVKLETDGKITGIAKVTRKKEAITKIASEITVNGQIESSGAHKLYLDLQEKDGMEYRLLDFSATDMEQWKISKGIPVAKALCNKYPYIYLFRNSQRQLIKNAGYLAYFDRGYEVEENFYGVELSFEEEGKEIRIYCHKFSDAVTEINNQKSKRDYKITLKKGVEHDSLKEPENLKFPTKKYINSLILRGEGEGVNLAYLGNLTFTGPVTLQNISFVQMVKQKGEYKKIKEVKEDYPGVVTIKTGGFDLVIEGNVTFDTPVKIDGGTKGSLILRGRLNTVTNDYEENSTKDKFVIYGMLTNLQTLMLEDRTLSLREVKAGRSGTKYTASSNKIATLFLEDDARLEIIGSHGKNSLTVQNTVLNNSEILVEGNGNFKNVRLEGEKEAVIRVDKTFNITGSLEVNTDNGRLETRRKGAGKEPYLNVSGNVSRGENRSPVYVGVYYEISAGEQKKEEAVELSASPKATGQLLTAKKALATDFRPMEENYPAGEFSEENTNGYIMIKKGQKIYVYAGED